MERQHAPPHPTQPADWLDSTAGTGVSLLPPPGSYGLPAAGEAVRDTLSGPVPAGEAQVPTELHVPG